MNNASGRFSAPIVSSLPSLIEFPAAVTFGFFVCIMAGVAYSGKVDESMARMILIALISGVAANIFLPLLAHRLSLGGIWNLAFAGIGITIPCAVFLIQFAGAVESGINLVRLIVGIIIIFIGCSVLLIYKCPYCSIRDVAYHLVKNVLLGLVYGTVVFLSLVMPMFIISMILDREFTLLYSVAASLGLFVVFIFVLGAILKLKNLSEKDSDASNSTMQRVVSYLAIPAEFLWFISVAVSLIKCFIYNSWEDSFEVFLRIFPLALSGYFLYVLADTFDDNTMLRIFRGIFAVGALPLISIGIWRLITEISRQGIVENRYFAAMGYILLIVCQILMILKPRESGMAFLITLFVLLFVAVQPIMDYEDISAYTQVARAEKILVKNGMLVSGELVPPTEISDADRIELSRTVEYLCDNNQIHKATWLPVHFNFEYFADVFGIAGEFDEDGASTVLGNVITGELSEMYYNISDYDIMLVNYTTYNLYNFSMDSVIGNKGVYSVKFTDYEDDNITIAIVTLNGKTVLEKEITDNLGDIATYVRNLSSRVGDTVTVPLNQMQITLEGDTVDLTVVIKSVTLSKDGSDDKRLATVLTDTIMLNEK